MAQNILAVASVEDVAQNILAVASEALVRTLLKEW